jgi:hypothetical protein
MGSGSSRTQQDAASCRAASPTFGPSRAALARMKLTHIIAALALTAGLTACKKKKEEAKTEPAAAGDMAGAAKTDEAPKEAPKASGRSIPNSQGLVVDAPAKWQDNGIGGAAGMHLDGLAGDFQVRELEGEEAAKKFDDWKKETEEMLFQKWISADETADGWKALYTMDKIKMEGDEPKKDGSTYAFTLKRKIGDKTYYCSGSALKQEDAQEALDLCTKVAAK